MGLTIEYLEEKEDVFDITVEGNHNFYANDILVHNCLEIALPTNPLENVNDDGTDLKIIRVKKENLSEFLTLKGNRYSLPVKMKNFIKLDELYEIVDNTKEEDGYFYLNERVDMEKQPEISLCTLSAFNLGELKDLDELEELAELAVRALDSLLDYQNYPVKAAINNGKKRRTLGIGVINYAYYLAKNGVRYSDGSANALTHRTFEAIQYYLLRASVKLAKEYGRCEKFSDTTYAKGILPIDTYKKDVDEYCSEPLHYDWEGLREEIKTHGLRNSTMMALMPSECQATTNKMKLKYGSNVSLSKIISMAGLNQEEIESIGIPQRFPTRPIALFGNNEANEIYYNGKVPVFKIELEDGNEYEFTANHRLKVIRDNKEQWVEVKDLAINDDIVEY